MKTAVNTTLPVEVKTMATTEGINFNEALEFGIRFLLADKDGGLNYEYPESKLFIKFKTILNRLTEQIEKVERLENLKLEIKPADELEPENQDEIFNATPDKK